jgi:hypothetical protein
MTRVAISQRFTIPSIADAGTAFVISLIAWVAAPLWGLVASSAKR